MPVFRFVVDDGSARKVRAELDLPDFKTAKAEAVTIASERLNDIDGAFWKQRDWRLDVTDETDLILCSLVVYGVDAPAGRSS